jgi:hypothetical protein
VTAPASTPVIPPHVDAKPTPTHACVRCGAPVAIDVGLCERCNPLGLRDSSASQVHGLAIGGVFAAVVILAIIARLSLSGVGPFVATAVASPDGNGLAVTLSVTNQGSSTGQTTCRVTDPADRTGATGAIILSPRIEPKQTLTFTTHVTALGTTARPLDATCSAP